MGKGCITMSHQEIDRVALLQSLLSKQLRQREVAERLGLSVRQVKRLVARYRAEGAAGLVSRQRGRQPNNAIPEATRVAVMDLVRSRYADFGPTLAREKLVEQHGFRLSVETLRQWMVAEALWVPKGRKRAAIHQRRPRRPCFGELIQIDGSPHDWFEDRGPRCTLLVFIDDATSCLMALRFVPAESTHAYLETLKEYLSTYGRPVALYSDKHSVFRVNRPDQEGTPTQFTRALQTLDIQAIHANTPQAKGRVERANQTLQDRLVKELRLRGISDSATANAFLPEFIADYNARFATPPQQPQDAHRPLLHSTEDLALILSVQHTRKLSKNLTFQFKNREYQLVGYGNGYRLRGALVTVCEASDGTVTLLHQGQPLAYRLLTEGEPLIPLEDEKSLHLRVDQAQLEQAQRSTWKPAPDHPWRRYAQPTTPIPTASGPT